MLHTNSRTRTTTQNLRVSQFSPALLGRVPCPRGALHLAHQLAAMRHLLAGGARDVARRRRHLPRVRHVSTFVGHLQRHIVAALRLSLRLLRRHRCVRKRGRCLAALVRTVRCQCGRRRIVRQRPNERTVATVRRTTRAVAVPVQIALHADAQTVDVEQRRTDRVQAAIHDRRRRQIAAANHICRKQMVVAAIEGGRGICVVIGEHKRSVIIGRRAGAVIHASCTLVAVAKSETLQSMEQLLIGLEAVRVLLLLLLLLVSGLGEIVHRIQLREAVGAAVAELLQVLALMVEAAQLLAKRIQLMVNRAQIAQVLVDSVYVVVVADVGVVVIVAIYCVAVWTVVTDCCGEE